MLGADVVDEVQGLEGRIGSFLSWHSAGASSITNDPQGEGRSQQRKLARFHLDEAFSVTGQSSEDQGRSIMI